MYTYDMHITQHNILLYKRAALYPRDFATEGEIRRVTYIHTAHARREHKPTHNIYAEYIQFEYDII